MRLHVFYKHDFDVKKDTLIDHEINEKIAHIYLSSYLGTSKNYCQILSCREKLTVDFIFLKKGNIFSRP